MTKKNSKKDETPTAVGVGVKPQVSTNSDHICPKCGKVKFGHDQNTDSISREYCMNGYSDSIQNYKYVLSDLVKYAETEKQRENLELLIQLFKNKFKNEQILIHSVWELEADIYKWRTIC
jgi:predicted RNA-binding Zn-ribbon protein involved in translation (DUF1610 family)